MRKNNALKHERKPTSVQRARYLDDSAMLSHLGKEGAEQANDNREARKAQNERVIERRLNEDKQMRIDANEHIVPIDSDDERPVA